MWRYYFSVVVDNTIHILDLAAKIDATAEYLCKKDWGEITFPPPFGRDAFPEVVRINLHANRIVTTLLQLSINVLYNIILN